MVTENTPGPVEALARGPVAITEYVPTFLSADQWVVWSEPVLNAVLESLPKNEVVARARCGDICEIISLVSPAPGTPLSSVLTDGNIRVLANHRRNRGMTSEAVNRGTAALEAIQRTAAGASGKHAGPRPLTQARDQMSALRELLVADDPFLSDAARTLLDSLENPQPGDWPCPLSDNEFRRFAKAARKAGHTQWRWRWRELKAEGLRAILRAPKPLIDVVNGIGMGRTRLDNMARVDLSDVAHVASDVRGSFTISLQSMWEVSQRVTEIQPPKPRPTARRRPSAAAMRREREAILAAHAADPDPLSEELESLLHDWAPSSRTLDPATWVAVRNLTHDVMRRGHIRGAESFTKYLRIVGAFLGWCHLAGYDLDIDAVMRGDVIDRYISVALAGKTDKTRGTVRSKLRRVASEVSLSPEAPVKRLPIPYGDVKAPYMPSEEAWIRRQIELHPNLAVRRRLKTAVALGRGAGLDTRDIRLLSIDHVEDHGPDGIAINVPGDRARRVWVRWDYEDMLRDGISRLKRGEHILGRDAMHKDAIVDLYDAIQPIGDGPRIQQGRLRNTWIATLMTEPVPLWTIMQAAGLSGARTLADLVPYLAPKGDDRVVRGAA